MTLSALFAGTMGYAVQRGATCLVAAIDQLVNEGRWQRTLSILNASVWVLGGLLLARWSGITGQLPVGFEASLITVAGGVLLGLGAYVNRACVFGAVTRCGSGDWNYLATPLGFYMGCVAARWTPNDWQAVPVEYLEPAPSRITWLGLGLLMLLGWQTMRLITVVLRRQAAPAGEPLHRALAATVWHPTVATSVIGITFVGLLLLAGAWSYTDVLAELARGASQDLAVRLVLFAALFVGALLGGWTAGRWRRIAPTPGGLLRCLTGGLLMGLGGVLAPGGNDGLLLMGVPLLWGYAWVAALSMAATIALSLGLARRLAGHPRVQLRSSILGASRQAWRRVRVHPDISNE